jgi:hypothetical protein
MAYTTRAELRSSLSRALKNPVSSLVKKVVFHSPVWEHLYGPMLTLARHPCSCSVIVLVSEQEPRTERTPQAGHLLFPCPESFSAEVCD